MSAPELHVRLNLPYRAPDPALSLNFRGHWSLRARAAAQVREDVTVLARQAGLHRYGPREVEHLIVQLVWAPGDRRRRDGDNLAPFAKSCVDALARSRADLVGIDLVADDTPEFVTVLPTVIEPPPATPGMCLRLWLRFAEPQSGSDFAPAALAVPDPSRKASGGHEAVSDESGGQRAAVTNERTDR